MGNHIRLPFTDPPVESDTAETTTSIPQLLESIPLLKIGETLRIGYVPELAMYPRLPEFDIIKIGYSLYEIRRKGYLANSDQCCIDPLRLYYWQNTKGEIFPNYRYDRILYTCDPSTKSFTTSSKCDSIFTLLCTDQGSGISRTVCNEWLGVALARDNNKEINAKYSQLCSKKADIMPCEDWLQNLRIHGYENIIDTVLLQQSPDFKEKYMKCSFPNQHTRMVENKVLEPRECWDPECSKANIHFILSQNYRNLALCNIFRCNISINNLLLDTISSLKISCHDKNTVSWSNTTKMLDAVLNASFPIKLYIFLTMFIVIAFILIVLL